MKTTRKKRLVSSTRSNLILDGYEGILTKGARILDLGCGNGAIGKAIEGRFNASVVGADIENFLEYDVPFHKITGKLEFADDAFDFAMFNDVLHHIPKPAQLEAILEAARVARKLLIFETAPTVTAKVLDVVMNYVVYGGREAVPLAHRSAPAWSTLMKGAGLQLSVADIPSPKFYYPLRHFTISADRGRASAPAN